MVDLAIDVQDLIKHFRVHQRDAGVAAGVKSLFRREYTDVRAVDGVSFSIAPGEIVGFLGPNGAGKTTTLKCLSGLLYPTSGRATVMGFTPHDRKAEFLRSFTLVMGQRNQLFWDLPATETFLVNQAIYRIPQAEFQSTMAELVDLLGLAPYLDKPVRNLSLGERMRAELAAALLHRPAMLFLDEPTLGLDVTAAAAVRSFLTDYNLRTGATVLLTSHYMIDVAALARRVIVIDHGQDQVRRRPAGSGGEDLSASNHQDHAGFPVAAAELRRYGEVESAEGLTASSAGCPSQHQGDRGPAPIRTPGRRHRHRRALDRRGDSSGVRRAMTLAYRALLRAHIGMGVAYRARLTVWVLSSLFPLC